MLFNESVLITLKSGRLGVLLDPTKKKTFGQLFSVRKPRPQTVRLLILVALKRYGADFRRSGNVWG